MKTLLDDLDDPAELAGLKRFIQIVENQNDCKLFASEAQVSTVHAYANKLKTELQILMDLNDEIEKHELEKKQLEVKTMGISKDQVKFRIEKVKHQKSEILNKTYIKAILEIAGLKAMLKEIKNLLEVLEMKEFLLRRKKYLDID